MPSRSAGGAGLGPSGAMLRLELCIRAPAALDPAHPLARMADVVITGENAAVVVVGLAQFAPAFRAQAEIEQHGGVGRIARLEGRPGRAGRLAIALGQAHGFAEGGAVVLGQALAGLHHADLLEPLDRREIAAQAVGILRGQLADQPLGRRAIVSLAEAFGLLVRAVEGVDQRAVNADEPDRRVEPHDLVPAGDLVLLLADAVVIVVALDANLLLARAGVAPARLGGGSALEDGIGPAGSTRRENAEIGLTVDRDVAQPVGDGDRELLAVDSAERLDGDRAER